MFYKRARQQAAALTSFMAQTKDSVVCFEFRKPIHPAAEQEIIDSQLRDCQVVDASHSFARYFGFKNRVDIIGKDMLSLVGETIPDWFVDYGQEVEDNQFRSLERVVKIPLGKKTRHMRIHMENIFEKDLLVRQWLTLRDVTEETETKAALNTKEQMRSLSLEAIGLDDFEFALPFSAEEDAPDWWFDIHEDDKQRVSSSFAKLGQPGQSRLHLVFRLNDKHDAEVWRECWAIERQRQNEQESRSAIAVLLDRTEEKSLENKILSSQRLESLGVLAGGIAHDFNNLLVSILGSIELTQAKHPEIEELLTPSNRAAEQLKSLCEQLLIYAGRESINHEPLNLTSLIGEFEEVLSISVDRNVSLTLKLENECWVEGDKSQLRQVVLNLVQNASDASKKSGAKVEVVLHKPESADWREEFKLGAETTTDDYVILTVRDEGEGVAEADVHRLFDPFFSTKFAGKGLGLAVVMGAAKTHQAGIKVQPLSQGMEFGIAFPAVKNPPLATQDPLPSRNLNERERILLIDDEPEVREIASAMFTHLGAEVESVDNAQQGIDLFFQDPDRTVFLDVTMPGMDGVEAASLILEKVPEAKIVLCSGYLDTVLPPSLSNRVGFIRKPFRLHQLEELLASLAVSRETPFS